MGDDPVLGHVGWSPDYRGTTGSGGLLPGPDGLVRVPSPPGQVVARVVTEQETFLGWLARENVTSRVLPPDSDGDVEVQVRGSYCMASVFFRRDGSFSFMTAAE